MYTSYYSNDRLEREKQFRRYLREKEFFRGGLIASWRDNSSIIHTRFVENKKKDAVPTKKSQDLWAITIRSSSRVKG